MVLSLYIWSRSRPQRLCQPPPEQGTGLLGGRVLYVGSSPQIGKHFTRQLLTRHVLVEQEEQDVTSGVGTLHQRHLQFVVTPVRGQQGATQHHQCASALLNTVHDTGGDVLP